MRRMILISCILIVMLLSLTVISVTDASTVHIVTYESSRYNLLKERVAPLIEAKYPGLKLKVEVYPWDTYWTKLYTMSGSGLAPDIIDTSTTYFFEFVTSGMLVKLDEFVKRDLRMEDYFLPPWSWCRYPYEVGEIYGIPRTWATSLLFYNKNLFDSCGVDYPEENWDWDVFLSVAKKLTKDTNGDGNIDQYGFLAHLDYTFFDPMLRSFGGTILDKTRTKVALDNIGVRRALELLANSIQRLRIAPPIGSPLTFDGPQGGKVGMKVSGSWDIGAPGGSYGCRNVANFDWDVAMLPRGPVSRVIHGHTGLWAVMRRPGQDIELVWRVAKELISEQALSFFAYGGLAPVLRKLALSEQWLEKRMPPSNKIAILRSAPYTQGADFSPNWSKWYPSMTQELLSVLKGQCSIEEGIKRAEATISKILKETVR